MNHPDSRPLKLIAPPPILYIVALLLGMGIHVLSPMKIFLATHAHEIVGGFLLLLSRAFARWAFLAMRRSGTSGNPRKPSEALVTDGPFPISRNPIYVAMTGLYIAMAFLVNSAWLLLVLVPLLICMHWGVILREEQYLSRTFGNEYTAYNSRVRRWL